MADKASKYSAPALEKGLDIIEYLSSRRQPCSQAEIAAALGRNANEIYRVLIVLEARGYLVREEVSGKYRLSLRLYSLAQVNSPIEDLRRAAELPMQELVAALGQACHLSIPYRDQLLVISQVRSPQPVSLYITEGTLFPLTTTTSGRLLLAHYTAERRERLLAADEGWQAMSAGGREAYLALMTELADAKSYFCESEITIGVTDCAALVGGPSAGVMAAIAVSSLSSSMGKASKREEVVNAVQGTALEIERRIGLERT